MAYAKEINYWDLEPTTDLEIIVFDETKAICREKMEFINDLNESVEIKPTWFPLIWPYDVNTTEYSVYPYYEWKRIDEDAIEYVHASVVEQEYEKVGIVLPDKYLEFAESYPLIPGILFQKEIDIGEKTGFATQTKHTPGLISEINETGSYSLYIEGFTEGRVNSITVKIPRQISKYWFFSADLQIQKVSPLFSDESSNPEYKIYRWEEDFLMKHLGDAGRNVTQSKMEINYSYVISSGVILTNIVILVVPSIFFILVGIAIQRVISKKFPEKKNNGRGKKKK